MSTKSFSTDWDIEDYYEDTEPEEHWELRKEFMTAHKDKFPEDYLVALARTFTNIEFLGCIYPAELMVKIAALSEDVAKNYREKKKTKLQRTFVTASNAAENRFTSRKSDPTPLRHVK